MHTAVFLVSNIHCPSCVSYVQDILYGAPGIHTPVDVSLIDQTVHVRYDEPVIDDRYLLKALLDADFEVRHVTVADENNHQVESYEVDASSTATESSWFSSYRRAKRKHIENCDACKSEKDQTSKRSRAWSIMKSPLGRALPSSPSGRSTSTGATLVDRPAMIDVDGVYEERLPRQQTYTATISIGGMTGSSCSSAITEGIQALDIVASADVNLVGNYATIVFHGPELNTSKLIEAIEDLGYEATLDQVQPQIEDKTGNFKAILSIGGMTCGSCVSAITNGVRSLPHISSVSIDLIGASGNIEFDHRRDLDAVLEKLDDLGYEASLVSLTEPSASTVKTIERTIQISIDGMYCSHCPDRIEHAFEQFEDSEGFHISRMPTLKQPILNITYKPSQSSGLTARNFISVICAVDANFRVSLYKPPSLEERSRNLQHKERWYILRRLLFTGIVAIPTLIIGVIFMMALPRSSPLRMWADTPIWTGSVMRAEWALLIMTTPVMFYGTDMFHKRAFKEIWSMWKPKSNVPLLRRFYRFGSMNLLISAATMVAYLASVAVLIINARTEPMQAGDHRTSQTYFDTVTFLTFFILIGRFLEAYSKAKTGDAVSALSDLRPTDALLVEDGIKKVPVDYLEVGDIVQIPHGHSPPTDGVIEQDGTFLLDESSLTGESKPVKKSGGDLVYAGTVNMSDPMKVKVTETGGTSMLDKIISVVREGQAKRAPIERLADILTGYFVPVITLLAVITWLIWLGLGVSGRLPIAWKDVKQGGWPFWSLEFAIAVFVVACPCGIGLAAPTALFVGGGLAAKQGILVQGGGEAFQEASRLDTIVFDKTGTLTQGQMRVVAYEHLSDRVSEELALAITHAMEEVSTHPIAKAIADRCKDTDTKIETLQVKEAPGLGMTGKFLVKNGSTSSTYEADIGTPKLVDTDINSPSEGLRANSRDEKQDPNYFLDQLIQRHQSQGRSTAILYVRHTRDDDHEASVAQFQPIAIFAIADPIRPEAPGVLQAIQEQGLEVHMCTGDNQTTALAIASQLGIPIANVRAGVLPQDKAAYINELQHTTSDSKDRRIVAFVGDGTNDTPALSAADVSIALSSGSDVAMTSSSFILLNSDLTTILNLITLSKRVFRRVKINFAWAAIYNICLIPVAAGVFFMVGANESQGGFRLSPVWASIAMAASSVSVVLSSLSLKLPEVSLRELKGKLRWQ